jgi:hypothetical protein
MATQSDVRRIAMALPETEEGDGHFAFSVRNKAKLKGFAWVWMERIDPKKARVANPSVLAIRVASVGERDAMITAEPKKFFTEPHYAGFPAVLVRLAEVSVADLRVLLAEGWKCLAPVEIGGRGKPIAKRTGAKKSAAGTNAPKKRGRSK